MVMTLLSIYISLFPYQSPKELYQSASAYVMSYYETQNMQNIEIVNYKRPNYNITLNTLYQDYTWERCIENNIPYELFLAMMYHESKFDEKCIGVNDNGTEDIGFTQINTINFKEVSKILGIEISEISDPYINIDAGIYLFGKLLEKYQDETVALIAYNAGETGMKRIMKNHDSTAYSRLILEYKKTLLENGGF